MSEIIGWCGCITICLSMFFNPRTKLGNILFRSLNLVGSVCYIIHGLHLNSYSMVVLNTLIGFLNILYLTLGIIKKEEKKVV